MFCGFDVEIMVDLQMRSQSNGFDGFADGWMVKSWWMWCCNHMETNKKTRKEERQRKKWDGENNV
jgi:hypothetical protein